VARTPARSAGAQRARRLLGSIADRLPFVDRRAPRPDDAATRYLQLLAAGLLNELYLDHELRLLHLSECVHLRTEPDRSKLGDPVREMPVQWNALADRRLHGLEQHARAGRRLAYAEFGAVRLAELRRCLDLVRDEGIEGDFLDCGPGRGGAGVYMRGYADAYSLAGRSVWVVDAFRVRPAPDDRLDVWTDLHAVRDAYARFHLLDDRVRFVEGRSRAALARAGIASAALIRLGRGDEAETEEALEALEPRLVPGGIVVVDDYDDPARHDAVARFRAAHASSTGPVHRVGEAMVWWRKPTNGTRSAPLGQRDGDAARVNVGAVRNDLSVVVVFYNMQREAARTLHSLTRAYQRGVHDLDYEVIVVENGSSPDRALGAEFVTSFGPEFRYLDLGPGAPPSPVTALNRGLDIARGNAVAFMIDGAHVLTPGVLRHAMAGLQTYAPAIVLTQLFYVGPGQQPDTVRDGYDQSLEDALFEQIDWPNDGYRLFDIGHFVGDRDWFDGMWESNCIFVPRSLLTQNGGYDDRFTIPGGGYANPEFYERLARQPDVNVVTILGEGSFHQVHGGTTTNADPHDRAAARFAYVDEFRELTGRAFRGAGKRVHYVGSMFPGAARTRARHGNARTFIAAAREREIDDTGRAPIPDDLKSSFIEAFWASGTWRDATWLGRRVMRAPTDLYAYQELIARTRPEWIITTGSDAGGRTLFFASMCDLVGHGQVVAVDPATQPDVTEHPRVHRVVGPPAAPGTLQRVRELVPPGSPALVVLGATGRSSDVAAEFDAYRPFVTPGSYAVIENTALNGHPVATDTDDATDGPYEAVRRIVARDREFVIDTEMERYGLTFNPIGFLQRKR
jgi:cephalosporin hydroxylase